jgi:hypothetical protein
MFIDRNHTVVGRVKDRPYFPAGYGIHVIHFNMPKGSKIQGFQGFKGSSDFFTLYFAWTLEPLTFIGCIPFAISTLLL